MDETNPTWKATSHKMILYMLKATPEFRNPNRSAYLPILIRSSITVFREGAIMGMGFCVNAFFQAILDDRIDMIKSISYDEILGLMNGFNNTNPPVPYTNPNDYFLDMMIGPMFFKAVSYGVFGCLGLWRLYSAASEIKSIWKEEFDAAHSRLLLPSKLAQDPVLGKHVCFISGRVMRIPVRCLGYYTTFDYLSLQNLSGPVICPLSGEVVPIENVNFRLDIFRIVQNRLKELAESQSPLLNIEEYKRLTVSTPIL
jgi:hypothetical protein